VPDLSPESSEELLAHAQDDWDQLRDALIDAVASGAVNPRVPAKLIEVGVAGVDRLLGDSDGSAD
jgi:hypothetical protein